MIAAYKLIPHFLAWATLVLMVLRGLGHRRIVALSSCAGFAAGTIGASILLLLLHRADFLFEAIKIVVGGSFLFLWGSAVGSIYASTLREQSATRFAGFFASPRWAASVAFAAAVQMGAVCAGRIAGPESGIATCAPLVLAGIAIVGAMVAAERFVPPVFEVSQAGLAAAVVALLLFGSSYSVRLDLFAPLTMKVMKFAHDFVHQFFESMLIPDHIFIQPYLWGYIGLLFGKGVGFWGALIVWFMPVLLIMVAMQVEPLPSVAHIRQGAQRRRVLAATIRERRARLVVPIAAVAILAGAVYRSLVPSVEYWDPKPIAVSATPSGEIFIPRKGPVDLEDGKLHKYLFKQGGREARFFVLMTPSGQLTADLDACSICKPDGYGQTEGMVICYYCKTLIPLDTVGKPGGCNPVPLQFTEKSDGVRIDALTLIHSWDNTVQATSRVKEGSK